MQAMYDTFILFLHDNKLKKKINEIVNQVK